MKGCSTSPTLRQRAPLWAALLALCALSFGAQAQVYRCPNNEYTNDPHKARAQGCKTLEGGNITVIHGDRSQANSQAAPRPSNPAAGNNAYNNPPRAKAAPPPAATSNAASNSRNAEAKRILQAELAKAEQKLSALQAEYKGGQPDRLGNERNYQKYLDRVAEMKSEIDRTQNDVSGLKREISRLP